MQVYGQTIYGKAERKGANGSHREPSRYSGLDRRGGLRREVRISLRREVNMRPAAEPNMPIRPLATSARIYVTPAFTCPKGCKCVGRCPAIEARGM
jgi:hypothetical protein